MDVPLIFEDMTKRYGSATVLDSVSVILHPGRIHALMGENGAGKSTFIKLIAGVVPANSMSVRKGDMEVGLASAADASAAGFRFIHQELNIVPQLSVAENILLGHRVPARMGVFVNWREMAARAKDALTQLGVHHIDPRRYAGELGVGDRMLIKLASALVADGARPCLYVLDEPTAALKAAEAGKLFDVLRSLKEEGAAILYVSHRIAEIVDLCDDVTVLRNGRKISTCAIGETSKAQMVRDMTGKDVAEGVPARKSDIGSNPVAAIAGGSSAVLRDISFNLAEGEVLGVAGLAGAGQTELLRLFLGLERLRGGSAQFLGRDLPASPSGAWNHGVAYVPQERRSEGLMMLMGARSNVMLPHLTGLLAKPGTEQLQTDALASRVKLRANSIEQPVQALSGGNQQKVVFARAMAARPRLLLLDEPTRGVDVGARLEIYGIIREMVARGCACIIASSDLPELIGLGDRILILDEGQQKEVLEADELTPESLLSLIHHHRSVSVS